MSSIVVFTSPRSISGARVPPTVIKGIEVAISALGTGLAAVRLRADGVADAPVTLAAARSRTRLRIIALDHTPAAPCPVEDDTLEIG